MEQLNRAGGTITRIEVQNKRKNRLSIFLDEKFAFGLNIAVVARYNLKKGDVLSAERISDILVAEEIKQARESALRYLARRAHSEKELRTKLNHKRYSDNIITEIIAGLKKDGFVNDLEFARTFTSNRLASNPMGAQRLTSELWQKGIDEKIISQVVQASYAEKSEDEYARTALLKKQKRYQDLEPKKRKKRLYDFLLRRGFGWDVVANVLGD